MDEEIEIDDSDSLIDESVDTDIDESTTEITDQGDVTVNVIDAGGDDNNAEISALNDRVDALTGAVNEIGSRLEAIYTELSAQAATDVLQSEAINEVAEVVEEETSAEEDDMPASKKHRWWS